MKPGNVLLARQRGSEAGEHVYLSDFGLTKRSASDSGITGTGQFVGTLDYAAPEQFKGGTPDARTDVYSLGCVLFECLTGRPPFTSENDAGLMYAHLQEPPPSVTADRGPSCRGRSTGSSRRRWRRRRRIGTASAGALVDEATRALGVGVAERAGAAVVERTRLRRLVPAIAVAVALVVGIVAVVRRSRATPPAAASAPGHDLARASPSPTPAPTFRTVERASAGTRSGSSTYIPRTVSAGLPSARSRRTDPGRAGGARVPAEDVEVLYELFPTRDAMDAGVPGQREQPQRPRRRVRDRPPRRRRRTRSAASRPAASCATRSSAGRLIRSAARRRTSRTSNGRTRTPRSTRTRSGTTSATSACTSGGCRRPVRSSRASDAAATEGLTAGAGRARACGTGPTSSTPRKGARLPRRRPVPLHVDGTVVLSDAVGDGRRSPNETGTAPAQKPNRVVFSPASGYCFTTAVDRPSAGRVHVDEGRTTRSRSRTLEGGHCAGPQKMVPARAVWTRAPAGTIAFEQQGRDHAHGSGGASRCEALAPDTADPPDSDPDWSPDGSQDRLRRGDGAGGRRPLPDERGRHRPDAAHRRDRRRVRSGLVARREPDRLRLRRPRPPRVLHQHLHRGSAHGRADRARDQTERAAGVARVVAGRDSDRVQRVLADGMAIST